jgi:hypothetical protein
VVNFSSRLAVFVAKKFPVNLGNLRLIFLCVLVTLWPTKNFNQMRRGGKKLSNIFKRFYTIFKRFYIVFEYFQTFSNVFERFLHELARLVRKIEQGRPNNSSK